MECRQKLESKLEREREKERDRGGEVERKKGGQDASLLGKVVSFFCSV